MMGTSILSIPWGIKQVSPPLACTLVPSCLAPNAEEWCLALQAGFTLGILILIFTGLLMLYCCYIVLQAPKSIRESRTHLRFSDCTPATRRVDAAGQAGASSCRLDRLFCPSPVVVFIVADLCSSALESFSDVSTNCCSELDPSSWRRLQQSLR